MSTNLQLPEGLDLASIAIIGMAGRFPGAATVDEFWTNLCQGEESLTVSSRADLLDAGLTPDVVDHPDFVPVKGALQDADLFDASFFDINPREAEVMDPQQRVFLECAWTALEAAGVDPLTYRGRIGVFAGTGMNQYLVFNLMTEQDTARSYGLFQTQLASDKDFLATRTSYKLNLTGPSVTVQSACSTSAVAVHLACQSLLDGECDLAIAGGVSVSVPLLNGYLYEKGGLMSPDGHCRAFDAASEGTVSSNGVGIVVLRRLREAQAQGDRISAVIRGTAVNNDGSAKVGYTAPSVTGQAAVIAEALGVAGVSAETIGYVEAHGTGTPMGDPIELAALTHAFRLDTDAVGYCAVGSVKSNIGHLDAAAGVTGVIKAALALEREAIPATVHYNAPNPELGLDGSPFIIADSLRAWPRGAAPRRAGVSSFGIGGTNVHLVLEEAPARAKPAPGSQLQLLPLSAKNAAALTAAGGAVADHLERHPEVDLADVWYTLTRRHAFATRSFVACRDRDDAITQLRSLPEPQLAPEDAQLRIAFLFPGQGNQFAGMARELYWQQPRFREHFDRCAEPLTKLTGAPLTELVCGPDDDTAHDHELARTALTQPALFAVEYALAQMLIEMGITPAALAGHSVGELVAATLAGVFSLDDALRLVAMRGQLVQGCPGGAMVAVSAAPKQVQDLLTDDVRLCVVNSSSLCVLGGPEERMPALERTLADRRIACQRLRTSHAFHTPMIEAAVAPLHDAVARTRREAPRIPFCSNVSGTWITAEQATDPQYWGQHLSSTVRFCENIETLLKDPGLTFLEVGPGRSLTSFLTQHGSWEESRLALPTMPASREHDQGATLLLRTLGQLWSRGAQVNFEHLGEPGRVLVPLPGYVFQRSRFWVEPKRHPLSEPRQATASATNRADSRGGISSASESRPDGEAASAAWVPGWHTVIPRGSRPQQTPATPQGPWLVVGTDVPWGAALASCLAATGARVVGVAWGEAFSRTGDECTVAPLQRDSWRALFADLADTDSWPRQVVHAWSMADDGRLTSASLEAGLDRSFHALEAMCQAFADQPQGNSAFGDEPDGERVQLTVCTPATTKVTGHESICPASAAAAGLCRVLGQETLGLGCFHLDLESSELDPDVVADLLLDGFRDTSGMLAHRGEQWWARVFEPLELPQTTPPALRDGGRYLITGLGGVALHLAEAIASSYEAPVLGLLTRRAFPPHEEWADWGKLHPGSRDQATIERLLSLERRGTSVVVLQADVTEEPLLEQVLTAFQERHGALNGVIHTAGLPGSGLLASATRERTDAVLAPKTRGTVALGRVCASADLDFLILCSSRTALVGGPGDADYAAANAFLDAYAAWARPHVNVTAIDFDTWFGVGMATGQTSAGQELAPGVAHPLLQRLVQQDQMHRVYATTFATSQSWIVDDHRMMGHGLVPGTAFLEMVRAAVANNQPDREIEFHDVLFHEPVVVPDGHSRELFTAIEQDGDGMRFAVRSRIPELADGWRDHATGTVSFPERQSRRPGSRDAALQQSLIREVVEGPDQLRTRLKLDYAETSETMPFSIKGRWLSLTRLQIGDQGIVADVELPAEYAADLETYLLHPGLLDVLGGSSRVKALEGYYLPFWYGRLRVIDGLTSQMYCHVRLKQDEGASGETLACDIDVFDIDGRLLIEISDYIMKRIHEPELVRDQAVESAGNDALELAAAHGQSSDQARKLFLRVLALRRRPAQVAVSSDDLNAAIAFAAKLDAASIFGAVGVGTTTGVDRHPRPVLGTDFVAPSTPTQQAISEVWGDVLGVDGIGVDDDFFELGGHSLAAVQISTGLRERLGADLSLADFFESPTVRHTAELIEAAPGAQPSSRITPAASSDIDVEALSDDEVDAMLRDLMAADAEGE